MSALVLQVLRCTRELIADPRRWTKGHWRGVRDNGAVRAARDGENASCWCLSGALTTAVNMNEASMGTPDTWTHVRGEAERELQVTLGIELDALALPVWAFNDNPKTGHADVIALLDETLKRLGTAQ